MWLQGRHRCVRALLCAISGHRGLLAWNSALWSEALKTVRSTALIAAFNLRRSRAPYVDQGGRKPLHSMHPAKSRSVTTQSKRRTQKSKGQGSVPARCSSDPSLDPIPSLGAFLKSQRAIKFYELPGIDAVGTSPLRVAEISYNGDRCGSGNSHTSNQRIAKAIPVTADRRSHARRFRMLTRQKHRQRAR